MKGQNLIELEQLQEEIIDLKKQQEIEVEEFEEKIGDLQEELEEVRNEENDKYMMNRKIE